MKSVTIGYLAFQDLPDAVRRFNRNAAETTFEVRFKPLSKLMEANELVQYDVVFVRMQTHRWEWLEVLLFLNRTAAHIPVIVMTPSGSLGHRRRILQTVPGVFFIDTPDAFDETLTGVIDSPLKRIKQVLFVDDDENVLNGYKHALFRSPWKIHTASSARKALEILSTESISLIVTDIKMPEMHGFELIEEIRKIDTSLPVIVCSGYHGLKSEADLYFHNIAGFVEKPVEMPVLAAKIKEMLK
ncbi:MULTISPECIES: response regulator [Desulfococcus]|uniref:Response regulator receiver protein n=1 Tax=Desulfococcus multivorans DSM 2059 TaxID=1121405 RepID=S7TEQ6_DESML|nr:response regulator [Desulfococcus multivorans]AQV01069.1 response regulator [Desulfococcus multivorans]EPR35171.1 response regulator receiver protein [Desulfococcus multivorans DSM 2059]SJZ50206.1 Response regulator receiver domain-containing protein [Desulfococcus multivorans DSM 2059]